MKLKRKLEKMFDLKVNEYRYLYNDLKRVKKDYDEGLIDLNFRLSFFHEKVLKTNNKELIDRFESKLEGYLPKKEDNQMRPTNLEKNTEIEEVSQIKEKKSDHPKWAKKLYRKIAVIAHPDKTQDIKPKILKDMMNEYFEISAKSYEESTYEDLLMIGHDLKLDFEKGEQQIDIIKKGCKEKKVAIKQMTSSMAYNWNYIKEDNRASYFKKILVSLGFDYSDEEIEKVIKKVRPVSKPRVHGEKPKKGVLNRRKSG